MIAAAKPKRTRKASGRKAWTGQRAKDVRERGKAKASWLVYWNDPAGIRHEKSCGTGHAGKRLAEKEANRLHAELVTGTYQDATGGTWAEFRAEYDRRVLAGMKPQTQRNVRAALAHFERIGKPHKMATIRTATIADFVATRRTERGKKRGSKVSPAAINQTLRHLKAALRTAHDWGYLPDVPKFKMQKEPRKLPRYVTPEHFATLYQAADSAARPSGLPYSAADWWRALLTFLYMTGWRVSEAMALRRDDLDLDAATAITRHDDNKGGRDERIPLHPVIVDHLRRLVSFDARVFPWLYDESALWKQFARIQAAAEIHLDCPEAGKHQCTAACHRYGFHDCRRAFASVNAETLTADALQTLMRHKSYTTTQKYIAIGRQLDRAVEGLHVPDVLKVKGA